jgi:hypothetical protein
MSDTDVISKETAQLAAVRDEPQESQAPQETPTPTQPQAKPEENPLDLLEPSVEPKRWIIGKPPEKGGKDTEYSVYVQSPLSWMNRNRFFALVANTLAEAIKAGGSGSFDLNDLGGEGSFRERAARLTENDFSDATSFLSLALKLVAYSPDFLLECYCLWLNVPKSERMWAKAVMEQQHDPDNNKWGLSDETGMEIINVFIDQNYEDIRSFFTKTLPQIAERVRAREAAHNSESDQSKQSKPSGLPVVETP